MVLYYLSATWQKRRWRHNHNPSWYSIYRLHMDKRLSWPERFGAYIMLKDIAWRLTVPQQGLEHGKPRPLNCKPSRLHSEPLRHHTSHSEHGWILLPLCYNKLVPAYVYNFHQIQKLWRGYRSRKHIFNFSRRKQYFSELTEKSENIRQLLFTF